MKTKIKFYTEAAYLCGIVALALGTALMEKANLGISMVVAPAYIIYRRLSLIFPFVTFGMAEYSIQAVLLSVMVMILRKFKPSYLISFLTAVLYGFALDGCMFLIETLQVPLLLWRVFLFAFGMLLCAVGVAFMFHTYISPEVYELFVKEMSARTGISLSRFKTIYDRMSLLIGILLSFFLFGMGTFIGIGVGTVFSAVFNGKLIGYLGEKMEGFWSFEDGLPFRKYF